jgi:hypothetical protein
MNPMTMPHDVTDLYLSPVALAVDERLAELGTLSDQELTFRLALETNSEPRSRAAAESAVLADAAYLVDTHGWDIEWDPRGVRLTHDGHTLVLGVPANVRAYVESFAPVPVS